MTSLIDNFMAQLLFFLMQSFNNLAGPVLMAFLDNWEDF